MAKPAEIETVTRAEFDAAIAALNAELARKTTEIAELKARLAQWPSGPKAIEPSVEQMKSMARVGLVAWYIREIYRRMP